MFTVTPPLTPPKYNKECKYCNTIDTDEFYISMSNICKTCLSCQNKIKRRTVKSTDEVVKRFCIANNIDFDKIVEKSRVKSISKDHLNKYRDMTYEEISNGETPNEVKEIVEYITEKISQAKDDVSNMYEQVIQDQLEIIQRQRNIINVQTNLLSNINK